MNTPSPREGGASGDRGGQDFFRHHLSAALKAKKSLRHQQFLGYRVNKLRVHVFGDPQRLPTGIRKPGTCLNDIVGAYGLGDGGDVELRIPRDTRPA